MISAGGSHTCALKTKGIVACWGLNSSGQASPPAGSFTSVAAGKNHSCGVKADGTLASHRARVSAIAAPGEVLVTRTVRDLVMGSEIEFENRGVHALKGISGEWELFAVHQTAAVPAT